MVVLRVRLAWIGGLVGWLVGWLVVGGDGGRELGVGVEVVENVGMMD